MSSLLRSTKFVRYFTGAARTLILNTAKTAEVSTLINSKALSAVNNVGIRDYATTKKTESLEPLLQKLDLEVRKYGRITKRDIDEVFDELRGKNDITSSQSLLVIRCCGELVPEELPEQRTLLVQKIWSVLTERGVPMDISHYNALLRVYLENEHQFSPAKFLEELEKKGLQPNRVTYQRLMWRYCQEGDVEGATKVLEKMRELNFPVSEPVLNALVMGHAFHGDTEGAKAVLETMATAGLEPSNRTYTLLACGYAKKGDIEGVENVIKTATQKEALLTDKDVLEVIEHLSLGGHGDKVEQLFTHLNKGFGYNQEVCNVILRLLNKGHDDVAKKLMHTMPKSSTAEDTPFKGAFFIKQLLRLNKSPSTFIKTCKELRDEGLIPNAIFIATEGALQQGQVELAQELFKELKNEGKEVRQHYFWPLLAQKGKEGDEEGLLQIVRNMIGEGLSPSGETLRDYVIPYLVGKDTTENIILKLQIANVPAVHAARNLMAELLDAGDIKKAADVAVLYRPRGQYGLLSRPLIHAVSKSKDIDSFATILHVLCSNPPSAQAEQDSANDDVQTEDKGDSDEVGRIVKATVKSLHKPELAAKLLQALHSKGIRISADAAEEIQQHLGQNLTTDLSELLAQLTSSDLEHVPLESPKRTIERNSAQLEQLISRLKSREGTNVNRLQKQLLNVYMKENNVEKLNSYLKELKASNFELNMITLAQLFEFYCVNDQIEKADEIQAIIHEKDPEFVLSNLKVMQKAHALVRAKKYDEAFQFLKENKAKPGQDSTSFLYNSKCWQILNTLAENKDADNVKRFTDLLIDEGYIEASNVILGPSVKVNLLNDDLDGALKAFEESTKKYRSTPWKGELMKVLILKEDASKLQWLADLSTQIHGEVNILHDLVLAFVECGRLRQARRILETPGMHARQRRLDDACQRYLEEGKSEHLEGLLEATKELSHIDRSNIFYHLLVTYCKANETDKALGLWTLLQEEGEVPSDQFLTYLGQHLKSKKMSVPFIIPSEKVQVTQQVTSPKPKKAAVKEANNKPTKKEISDKIENFVKDGKVEQAFGLAIKSLKENVMPKPGVMKFMLKAVAETGDVEKLQELGKLVNENMKREITFDNKLTHAEFVRGRGADHVEALLRDVTAASDHELDVMLRRFPRSNTLASVLNDDNIASKCHKIAEIAASKGQLLAANLLWIEYILEGRQKEADSLWKLWLNNASILLFRRLLQEAHLRKEPQLIQKLIDALTTNKNVTQGSLGNAYSRLINLYLLDEKTNEALSAYERAIKSGVTLNHFNRHCIERLKSAAEAKGVEFKQPAN